MNFKTGHFCSLWLTLAATLPFWGEFFIIWSPHDFPHLFGRWSLELIVGYCSCGASLAVWAHLWRLTAACSHSSIILATWKISKNQRPKRKWLWPHKGTTVMTIKMTNWTFFRCPPKKTRLGHGLIWLRSRSDGHIIDALFQISQFLPAEVQLGWLQKKKNRRCDLIFLAIQTLSKENCKENLLCCLCQWSWKIVHPFGRVLLLHHNVFPNELADENHDEQQFESLWNWVVAYSHQWDNPPNFIHILRIDPSHLSALPIVTKLQYVPIMNAQTEMMVSLVKSVRVSHC